jgi:Sulfatase
VSFARAALHLGGLWALAFAQPLFDLLGRNAQFFVARGSTAGDILLLAFGYALVPPLAGALLVWALGRIRPELGWWAMLVLVALIVAGLLLPPAGDVLAGSAVAVPVALALGAGVAALYARFAGVRSFATVLSVAPLVVLLLFLLVSPVRGLLFPAEAGGAVAGPARSTTPIVHVVLDELPQSTLATAGGEIDAELFPNFARLARESTWYRNATTADDLTTEAVPAQLTGLRPQQGRIPTTRDHPRSLFTLFERSHELTVIEPITDLCPARLCEEARPDAMDRLESLESDLEVVVQHLLLPEDMRDGLPAIDRVWEGFETQSVVGPGELRGGSNLRRDVLDRLAADDATAGFEQAIASLDSVGARPPLLFLHSTLPHGGWRYLPDGRQYPVEGLEYIGLASEGWIGPQWQVDQGFQRHVLQVQYTDTLVGRLLDALRASGLYDDAVVVVAADHGASFVTGRPRRPATRQNVGAIAPVPLFVKLPRQARGRVDDRAVRTTDVLPTIAAAAGVSVPWPTDGMPVAERRVDDGARIDVSHAGEPAVSEALSYVLAKRAEREAVEARLLRDGLYAMGPRPDLIGRRLSPRGWVRRVDVDPESPVLPSFIAGDAGELRAGTELAVVVNGRVEATTRVYRDDGRSRYAALVPPSSLRAGANEVAVFEAP